MRVMSNAILSVCCTCLLRMLLQSVEFEAFSDFVFSISVAPVFHMNATWYFDNYYNEDHITLYKTTLNYVGPISLLLNAYGLYLLIFHSAKHLQFMLGELLFHQITLIVFDIITLDAGKIVVFFPIPMGYAAGWAASTNPTVTCITLSAFFVMWAITCSTILRILIRKHQNLWPPGSKWKLTTVGRHSIYASCHLASVIIAVPTMVNGLNFERNKKIIAERYPFAASFLDSPYFFVLDDENIWFVLLMIGVVNCVAMFMVILTVTIVFAYVALRRSRHQYSAKTYRMQVHYLTILIAQMSAPLFFSILPCTLIGLTIFARIWVPISVNMAGMGCAGLHGFSSTVLQIALNKCYWDATRNWILYPFTKLGIYKKAGTTSEQRTITTVTQRSGNNA